jgi:hypothetical protein
MNSSIRPTTFHAALSLVVLSLCLVACASDSARTAPPPASHGPSPLWSHQGGFDQSSPQDDSSGSAGASDAISIVGSPTRADDQGAREQQARQARIARLEEEARASQGQHVEHVDPGTTSDSSAVETADHISELNLVHDSDKLLIQFRVASAHGKELAIPGKVAVWIDPTFYPWDPKTNDKPHLAVDTTIQPEHLVDGLGRECIGYRVEAIPWPRTHFRVRLEFDASPAIVLQAQAKDTE